MQISLWSELKKLLGEAKLSFDLRLALKVTLIIDSFIPKFKLRLENTKVDQVARFVC